MMYGIAARSTSQTIRATGKNSTTEAISTTPVAACVSRARTIRRFHVACRTAAASARASAAAGPLRGIQQERGCAVALDRGGRPVQAPHPAAEPVGHLVVVLGAGGVAGLAAAEHDQRLVRVGEVRDEPQSRPARLRTGDRIRDRVRG